MAHNRNLISRIQNFMDSPKGKTMQNYLYSWGASVVILGALFKLVHISGADLMLFVGMGTEVIVFFFAAFERTYDVEEAADEAPAAQGGAGLQAPIVIGGGGGGSTATSSDTAAAAAASGPIIIGGGGGGGGAAMQGPIIIGGGGGGTGSAPAAATSSDAAAAAAASGPIIIGGGGGGGGCSAGIDIDPGLMPQAEEATQDYIDRIKELAEAMQRLTEQSSSLERNMQELDQLGRNLTGINTMYEMQLRSVSSQVGNIDNVNEQTRRMAQQIEELNKVYARMLEAMTTNMNMQAPRQL